MVLKKLLIGGALVGLLLNGACGKNSDNNTVNPTRIVSYSVPEETSDNFKIGANIEDTNGIYGADIRFYDTNSNEIGYMLMDRVSGDTTNGKYETPSFSNLDGEKLIFEVSVVEGSGPHLKLGKQNYNIYLSNQHGKEAILNAITNHSFDSNPTGIRQDLVDVINGTNIEADVAVDFNKPLTYNGTLSNNAIIYFNYLSKNNDNSIDPQGDQSVLDNVIYNGTTGIPNIYFPYDNLGTPTTRADIEGLVDNTLTNEDLKIIYK